MTSRDLLRQQFGDQAIRLKHRFPALLGDLSDLEHDRLYRLKGAQDVPGGQQLPLFDQPTKETQCRM